MSGSLLRLGQCWSFRQRATTLAFGLGAMLSIAEGQMDPAEMQRQIQQQMGGGSGGAGGAAAPNRVGQLVYAAGAGGAAIARSAREHPRTAMATAAAATTALWVGAESRRSGLLVCRSPRISLFRPSDAYLSGALETAADAPVASPLRGVILSPLQDPDAREEKEEGVDDDECVGLAKRGSRRRAFGGDKKGRRTVGSGGKSSASRHLPHQAHRAGQGAAEIQAVLDRAKDDGGAGTYTEEGLHGKGRVKSVCAGVRVGAGLSLYHKFAQGLGNLDVFDGRSDCELLAGESSSEDVGSTLALLTRGVSGTWGLSPVRVVIRRETSSPVPRAEVDDRGRRGSSSRKVHSSSSSRRRKRKGGDGAHSKERKGGGEEEGMLHRQYTLALSAVEGAGWSGTWVFRVTYDAETEEVWFQTSLAQRKGPFGTTAGGDQGARVKMVNDDMLKRGSKHAAVLRTREEQFTRVSSLARRRAKDTKELERDRILHPDKYKRVHRYMREDSHTTGGATARPARWGEERRRNDIRLK